MQKWFSLSGGDDDRQRLQQTTSLPPPSSSLLADWNSYATSKASEESGSGVFDLESAVRSANDTVTGTFSV
ncbi:Got1/Sft2-like vescicle transport protein family [Actinidia rufa]|uniref:Got1/Sft2-like vescicle transport protein family n=2 Tax=Actinidia TaxID=3624 RepID=A0A7J0DY42_9ERIC|nr:Got1/Sft2-like vescicle transport protein family [Actinidia rufa]